MDITKTMGEILQSAISYNEHKEYSAIGDELALQVVRAISTQKNQYLNY